MPELPEVEFTKRVLDEHLRGARITAARVGRTIRQVSRRGKWLRVQLDNGARIFSHLGLTGSWVVCGVDSAGQRAERARIDVERDAGASSIRYVDTRRFGRLVIATDDIDEWAALGPDPLVDGIRVGTLAAALAGSRRTIKDALMDQSVLAGIGNILATEALWHAQIRRSRPLQGSSRSLAHDG